MLCHRKIEFLRPPSHIAARVKHNDPSFGNNKSLGISWLGAVSPPRFFRFFLGIPAERWHADLAPGIKLDWRTFHHIADSKWVDYSPFWCTPLGRILILRGTTTEKCKSYCGEGCGAIEWWEGGSQACYLCTDLNLLMTFPHANDLSYPPHVAIKQPGMFYLPLFFCFNFGRPLQLQ